MNTVPLDYFIEKKDIEKYSDTKKVQHNANKYGLQVVFSPRQNKKFRIVNPNTLNYIDFGQINYIDFTRHQNTERQRRYKLRNNRFKTSPKYSAGWASYYILWE